MFCRSPVSIEISVYCCVRNYSACLHCYVGMSVNIVICKYCRVSKETCNSIFNLNVMFCVNFRHFYVLLFLLPRVLQQQKIVDFNILAVLLYVLFTRVSKICAHVFLIHVLSRSFIMRSFSLTLNNCRHIPFVVMFGDNRQKTPTHCHLMAYYGLLASLGYADTVSRQIIM
jgi:hypothetical protein